jgi:hypothetical protein
MQSTQKFEPKIGALIKQALRLKSRDYVLVDQNKDRKNIKKEAFDLQNQ